VEHGWIRTTVLTLKYCLRFSLGMPLASRRHAPYGHYQLNSTTSNRFPTRPSVTGIAPRDDPKIGRAREAIVTRGEVVDAALQRRRRLYFKLSSRLTELDTEQAPALFRIYEIPCRLLRHALSRLS
jgi:hypothetical protein